MPEYRVRFWLRRLRCRDNVNCTVGEGAQTGSDAVASSVQTDEQQDGGEHAEHDGVVEQRRPLDLCPKG